MTVNVQPAGDEKVLSPTPTVSFSKRVKDSPPAGMPPPSDEMVTVSARMHPMRTRSQMAIATIVHTALTSQLNNILSRSYQCVLPDLANPSHKNVSPWKLSLQRKIRTPISPSSDPYKYSDYSLVEHSEPLQLAPPGPFNIIIGDRIFDDDNENNDGN